MSTKMTPGVWLLIAATIALIVTGQLLLKRGLLDIGGSPTHLADVPRFLVRALTNPLVLLAIVAIAIGAPCWMIAISHAELSIAYPFMGLTIVLVFALSGPLFGERTPLNRWIGVGIVCIGLIVTTRA